MLEEVLLAGERPRELDDDVSGRGVAGVGGSVHIGEDIVQTSSVFLSTSLVADGIRERIGRRRRTQLLESDLDELPGARTCASYFCSLTEARVSMRMI